MAVPQDVVEGIGRRYEAIKAFLNERMLRLWAGAEAKAIGHGGVAAVFKATGISVNTVRKGRAELEDPDAVPHHPMSMPIRAPGAGGKFTEDKDPGIIEALDALVDPVTRGDPESPLRWTSKSTPKLAAELTAQGHRVSASTVGRLLREQGYSLQANAKTREGGNDPDRDAQFRYIADQVQAFADQDQPVISVDCKKKELVGPFINKGREYQPVGQPEEVNVHDFPDTAIGKAVPYGIYDVLNNEGWVTVGVSAETAQFAVDTIETWFKRMGRPRYGDHVRRLLITADSGGSNAARSRLFKCQLQRFADTHGVEVTVLHYPPGTSKWNKIEHRLFSHISMNWRGRPLVSFETVVECISATTTNAGLSVKAEINEAAYERGIKVSDPEMKELSLERHEFRGDWNYTIRPRDQADG